MSLNWSSNTQSIPANAAGSIMKYDSLTIPVAPGLTVDPIAGNALEVEVVGSPDNADGSRVYQDTDNTFANEVLVADIAWQAGSSSYITPDIGEGTTLWYRVTSYNNAGEGAPSAGVSGTTTASAGIPGSPTNFTVVDNQDGSVNFTWELADALNDELAVRIWSANTNQWVDLVNLDSNPTATNQAGVSVPGASGAIPIGGEFGMRIRVANSSGVAYSNQVWTVINPDTDPGPGLGKTDLSKIWESNNFENGVHGEAITYETTGFDKNNINAFFPPVFDNTPGAAYSGTMCLKDQMYDGEKQSMGWDHRFSEGGGSRQNIKPGEGDELWVRWAQKLSSPWSTAMRTDNGDGGGNASTIKWCAFEAGPAEDHVGRKYVSMMKSPGRWSLGLAQYYGGSARVKYR